MNQRGVALISVLVVLTVATTVVTGLLLTLQLDLRRLETAGQLRQARAYALGMESWMRVRLIREIRTAQARGQPAALPLALFAPVQLEIDQGSLTGRLVDLDARYNLNNLRRPDGSLDPLHYALLERLLALLGLPADLAPAIADWVDADRETRFPAGAEDADYALLTPAYGAPNRPLAAVSELRGVRGLTPAFYARLAPFVSALPAPSTLNLNAAPGLLLALMAGTTGSGLETLRPPGGFGSVEAFLARAGAGPAAAPATTMSVQGFHFLVIAEARYAGVRSRLYSVLEREDAQPAAAVRVLTRSYVGEDE